MQTEAAYGAAARKMDLSKSKQPVSQVYNNNLANAPSKDMERASLDEVVATSMDKDGVTDYTQINQNMMRIEYEIKLKYSIESDNKAQRNFNTRN